MPVEWSTNDSFDISTHNRSEGIVVGTDDISFRTVQSCGVGEPVYRAGSLRRKDQVPGKPGALHFGADKWKRVYHSYHHLSPWTR